MKSIFTKEMLLNSAITLVVVLAAFYVDRKFLAPKMEGQTGSTGKI